MAVQTRRVINAATAPADGAAFERSAQGASTFQAVGKTTAGAGACQVDIQASNDGGVNWVKIGQIDLTLSASDSTDGFVSAAAWGLTRAVVVSISGTGATVSVFSGG